MQADPIVQAPDHSQSPNRYSYVFNNPLSYTDPTGFEAYVLNPWSDWLPVNGDWLSTMYRLAPATTRLEMKKYKKLDGAYGNHTPVDSNTEDGAANKVDSQQTGPTEVSDVHLGDGTINEIDGPYSKPQVTAPHKQILAKGESRRLTTDEIKLAMKIFGTAIDYSKTKIFREKAYFFQPIDRAMAPDGNIYFHPDSNDYYDDYSLAGATVQHTFIHELVHVWQHQHGINVRKAAMSGYDYWPMKRDRSFSSYNLEQQAQMVADYFMLKEHGLMWKSLSNQNPAPKAQDYERIIPFEYKK